MSEHAQYCTFYLEKLLFGIDVHNVQEVLLYQDMTRVPLAPPVIRGLVNLRGQIVTAIDLRTRMGLAPLNEQVKRPMNVVIRTADGPVSLLVDDIGDVVEVDSGHKEPPPDTLLGVSRELVESVVKLKERLLLILDTDEVLRFPGEPGDIVAA